MIYSLLDITTTNMSNIYVSLKKTRYFWNYYIKQLIYLRNITFLIT